MNQGTVQSVRLIETEEEVFDIGVLDNHNFFVRPKGSNTKPVLVHNCHWTAALQTSRILAKFNCQYLFGLSGTVERKVTEEIQIVHDLVGPIVHSCKAPQQRARLIPFLPGVNIKDPKVMSQAAFGQFQTRLESDSTRRNVIINEIIRYANQGHLVLVPLARVASILKWTREINMQTEKPGFALPYYGTLKKDQRLDMLDRARKYKCKVFVGNIRLLSTGLDLPRASCIFEVSPTSNIPKAEQRLNRILTPLEGKPQPIIVYVLDDSDIMRKCRRNEFWNCVKPRFDPIIYPEHMKMILGYLSGHGNSSTRMSLERDGGI